MAGFTLIEILVAFVIAVLALGALYRIASTGFAADSAATRYSRALLIAESTLDTVGTEEPLRPGRSTRRTDEVFEEEVVVRLRPDLLRSEDTASAPYPYEISVGIAWRDGRRARSLSLSTVRLGPAP
jgi:general secretion pathway protein I